jgi:hypothetical protein
LKKKTSYTFICLPTLSCEIERIITALTIIIRKQTSNSHARRKTGLFFYALHRKNIAKTLPYEGEVKLHAGKKVL